jgi:site-specific recombinase XerD
MSAKTTNISQKFLNYLNDLGISPKSHKNYRSDISHFSGWFLLTIRKWGVVTSEFSEAIPFITHKSAKEYRLFLVKNKVADKTINRRLSTLRHLSRFLTATQILDFDFMEGITNISLVSHTDAYPLLPKFEKYLSKEKASSNTIRNYVNDVKQFLAWTESKTTKPHTSKN